MSDKANRAMMAAGVATAAGAAAYAGIGSRRRALIGRDLQYFSRLIRMVRCLKNIERNNITVPKVRSQIFNNHLNCTYTSSVLLLSNIIFFSRRYSLSRWLNIQTRYLFLLWTKAVSLGLMQKLMLGQTEWREFCWPVVFKEARPWLWFAEIVLSSSA